MVHDHLSQVGNYAFANRLIEKGLEFLRSPRAAAMAVGRVDLDGDRLFALCQEYSTKPDRDCFWEAHRKYIDIQFIAAGVEEIGYAPLASLKIVQEYDPEKDFTKLLGEGATLRLTEGMFAIFFPHDAHKPCLAPGGVSGPVRKIVVKVWAQV
jgi:YhcH/YjgK/YiaL family protein